MKKNDFNAYPVGKIFNKFRGALIENPALKFKSVKLVYPSRLNAMALDPGKVTTNDSLKYSPGEIVIKVKIFKSVKIKASGKGHGAITISSQSQRHALIKHACLLMQKALKVNDNLEIDVSEAIDLRHVGLGSSSGLIASVACAINEIYGNPICSKDLLIYIAQNHGEEIEGQPGLLSPVQCIGGSASAGLYTGGLIVLAGSNRVIANINVDSQLRAIIGIPEDYISNEDAQTLLQKEIKNFDKVKECSKKYSRIVAYRLVHEVLPALSIGDIKSAGDLIFDYRFKMGSIEFCSYTYPGLTRLAKKLAPLKKDTEILSISSVGPAFFAITKKPQKIERAFKKNGLKTLCVEIENEKYKIYKKSR